MADLDDFFAKKDKKKKGKKAGFSKANTDVLAKKLESADLKELTAEGEKSKVLATSEASKLALEGTETAEVTAIDKLDDEWVQVEKEKDYSDLKIGNLALEEKKEDSKEDKEEKDEDKNKDNLDDSKEQDDDDDDEESRSKKKDQSIWANKLAAGSDAPEAVVVVVKKEEPAAPAAPAGAVVGGSYVPPHMRGSSSAAAAGPAAAARPRRTKAAPEINSEVHFPSLGGEAPAGGDHNEDRANSRDFEQVRSGGSANTSNSVANQRVATSNRFATLRD